jgi:hypothetical protein
MAGLIDKIRAGCSPPQSPLMPSSSTILRKVVKIPSWALVLVWILVLTTEMGIVTKQFKIAA